MNNFVIFSVYEEVGITTGDLLTSWIQVFIESKTLIEFTKGPWHANLLLVGK